MLVTRPNFAGFSWEALNDWITPVTVDIYFSQRVHCPCSVVPSAVFALIAVGFTRFRSVSTECPNAARGVSKAAVDLCAAVVCIIQCSTMSFGQFSELMANSSRSDGSSRGCGLLISFDVEHWFADARARLPQSPPTAGKETGTCMRAFPPNARA
jgi:hypothetical protein